MGKQVFGRISGFVHVCDEVCGEMIQILWSSSGCQAPIIGIPVDQNLSSILKKIDRISASTLQVVRLINKQRFLSAANAAD
jgi:hypothetical protein